VASEGESGLLDLPCLGKAKFTTEKGRKPQMNADERRNYLVPSPICVHLWFLSSFLFFSVFSVSPW
jgi:hypothetical protein